MSFTFSCTIMHFKYKLMEIRSNFLSIIKKYCLSFCLIFISFNVCAANNDTSALELITKIEGVYKRQFENGNVQGDKYTSENILEIVPYETNKIYFVINSQFFNGHICRMQGIANYEDGRFVFNEKVFNDEYCSLNISLKNNNIISIKDKNDVCRKMYCGNRGTLNDESFTLDRKRKIRYIQRILNSKEYKTAVENFKKQNLNDAPNKQAPQSSNEIKRQRFMDKYYDTETIFNKNIQFFEKTEPNCDSNKDICTIALFEVEKNENSKLNELLFKLLKDETLKKVQLETSNNALLAPIQKSNNFDELVASTYSAISTMHEDELCKRKYCFSAETFESMPGIIGVQINSLWWGGTAKSVIKSKSLLFSKDTQKAIEPKGLFTKDEFEQIVKLADKKFEEYLRRIDMNYYKLSENEFSELVAKHMKITKSGVMIQFDMYKISCGAAGYPEITIDFDEIKQNL